MEGTMETWKHLATDVAAASAITRRAAARRRWARQADWDACHLRSIGTKLTAPTARRLDAACAAAQVTMYELLAYLATTWLEAWESLDTAIEDQIEAEGGRDDA